MFTVLDRPVCRGRGDCFVALGAGRIVDLRDLAAHQIVAPAPRLPTGPSDAGTPTALWGGRLRRTARPTALTAPGAVMA